MTDERELLKKRFTELANRAYNSGIFTFTSFLGLAEQSAFAEVKRAIGSIPYTAFGGAEGCERVVIRFGSEDEVGYEIPFPISVIKAEPTSKKFAESLSHRDFLGSIMNLGIEREMLGDIVIIDNVGYIFALDSIAPYIVENLVRVRHTDMHTEIIDELPEGDLFKTERRNVQVSGERLDAIVARVFSISRDDAQSLFKKRLVFASGREIESTSYTPKADEVVSVRGHGRFIYRGFASNTRKGKMNIEIDVYV